MEKRIGAQGTRGHERRWYLPGLAVWVASDLLGFSHKSKEQDEHGHREEACSLMEGPSVSAGNLEDGVKERRKRGIICLQR